MVEDLDLKAGYQDKKDGPIVYVDGRDYFKKLKEAPVKKKVVRKVPVDKPVKGE